MNSRPHLLLLINIHITVQLFTVRAQVVSVFADVSTVTLLRQVFLEIMNVSWLNLNFPFHIWFTVTLILNVMPTALQTFSSIMCIYRRLRQASTMASLTTPTSAQLQPIDDLTCPICFGAMATSPGNADELVATPCGHVYHRTCLSDWLTVGGECPKCRRKIRWRHWNAMMIVACH